MKNILGIVVFLLLILNNLIVFQVIYVLWILF